MIPLLITEDEWIAIITTCGGAVVAAVIVAVRKVGLWLSSTGAALHGIRAQTDVAVRQTGGNGDNAARIAAQRAADAADELRVEQQEQTRAIGDLGSSVRDLVRDIGGIRSEIRQVREDGGQTRREVAQIRDSAEVTHRDLKDGQDRLDRRLSTLSQHADACGGWDYGDHETNFRAADSHHDDQEDT